MNGYLAGMALIGGNVKNWDELLVQFSIVSVVKVAMEFCSYMQGEIIGPGLRPYMTALLLTLSCFFHCFRCGSNHGVMLILAGRDHRPRTPALGGSIFHFFCCESSHVVMLVLAGRNHRLRTPALE